MIEDYVYINQGTSDTLFTIYLKEREWNKDLENYTGGK